MSSIKAILKIEKQNKNGESPIYFRIISDRKINIISTGIFIKSNNWDFKKSKVKPLHPQYSQINYYLLQKEKDILDLIISNRNKKLDIIKKIKNQLFDYGNVKFYPYAKKIIDSSEKNFNYILSLTIEKMKQYSKNENLLFADLDFTFFKGFESFLRNEYQLSNSSIKNYFMYLKRLFKIAALDKIINYADIPILNYKIKQTPQKREFLVDYEIEKIIKLDSFTNKNEELVRDIFIFCCFCGGIRISDIIGLKYVNFDGTHLSFFIRKTKLQHRIKVPQKGIEIINKYKKENCNPNYFIFPLIKDDINIENEEEFEPHRTNIINMMNKNLKLIMNKCEIKKHITFHCSRHTFATLALSKGIALEKVSKILGHSQIQTTQIYAQVLNLDVDKAMDLFNS